MHKFLSFSDLLPVTKNNVICSCCSGRNENQPRTTLTWTACFCDKHTLYSGTMWNWFGIHSWLYLLTINEWFFLHIMWILMLTWISFPESLFVQIFWPCSVCLFHQNKWGSLFVWELWANTSVHHGMWTEAFEWK